MTVPTPAAEALREAIERLFGWMDSRPVEHALYADLRTIVDAALAAVPAVRERDDQAGEAAYICQDGKARLEDGHWCDDHARHAIAHPATDGEPREDEARSAWITGNPAFSGCCGRQHAYDGPGRLCIRPDGHDRRDDRDEDQR